MLFHSAAFFCFFVVVYALYLALARSHRAQNALLLAASYLFYGAWDWRFLSLIAVSTAVDYYVGRRLADSEDEPVRRRLLGLSVAVNLGILGTCKYFDFFASGLADVAGLLGLTLDRVTLGLILPIGVSFYTFQSLSYAIDVYRRRIPACTSPLEFALFVAFFPQLVAGPIERAGRLLPQFARPRTIDAGRLHAGLFLITWGFFKKVVVADNCGRIANHIFGSAGVYSSLDLVLGVLAFGVQIYGDFSGYSDIARGLAKLLGFDLMVNFKLPYLARSPSDFWRRWHVSLSEWLRDYLYVPLGGNRGGPWRTARNLMLTMLLGGLWHGAAWTFVLWGAYHGALLALYRALRIDTSRAARPAAALAQVLVMFCLTSFGWLLFRAESVEQAVWLVANLGFQPSAVSAHFAWDLAFFALPVAAMEVWQHRSGDLLAAARTRLSLQVPVHAFLLIWIAVFGVRESMEFIYFRF